MNEPVAWIAVGDNTSVFFDLDCALAIDDNPTPLYTHPADESFDRTASHMAGEYVSDLAKTIKCMVKDCENHQHEGGFNGDICSPCYQFIAHGKGTNSQAYHNAHPAKTLTDEEIKDFIYPQFVFEDGGIGMPLDEFLATVRAILRKAQER